MSRAAQIILIVAHEDEASAEDLAFWMAGPEALDRQAFPDPPEADAGAQPPLPTVGHLLPINGAVGLPAWGGYKNPSSVIWGACTNHLHWDGFLNQVTATRWERPEAVQLLMADESDDCFRFYMLIDGTLTNLVPEPVDGDHERRW